MAATAEGSVGRAVEARADDLVEARRIAARVLAGGRDRRPAAKARSCEGSRGEDKRRQRPRRARDRAARGGLLHVIEGAEQPSLAEMGHLNVREYYRYLEEDAMARLNAAVPHEARVWCKPDERVVTGKAYRKILEIAAREGVELIVMGVHGKGALHVRLFGSTTHHLIRETRCPVLTLRG